MNVEEILQVKFRLEKINPQYLNNDHTHYQRFRIEKRVKEILDKSEHEDKSPAHLRIAGLRSDGTYWLINGQHHTEASVRLEIPSLEYKVFDSLGWEHERDVFTRFQKWQKGPSFKLWYENT